MSKTLNLIYSSPKKQLDFFGKIKEIRKAVLEFKSNEIINDFGTKDKSEISRGKSYAVFPELKKMVDKNQPITIEALRFELHRQGVVDPYMQNKVMAMLLQDKAGLHFAMNGMFSGLLFALFDEMNFTADDDNDLKLEVQSPNHVKLVFSSVWKNIKTEPQENSLQTRVEIDITQEKIAIYNFNVTQTGKSSQAKEAFKFLQDNQSSIWQKIVAFFKNYFSANSDLEIENVAVDNTPWKDNTKKFEEPIVVSDKSLSEEAEPENKEDSDFALK